MQIKIPRYVNQQIKMLSWRALDLFCNKKTINSRALKTAMRKMYFIDTKLQSLRNFSGMIDFRGFTEICICCTSLFCKCKRQTG